ncbi:hypothetical protein PENARI_c004G11538 [Penicillium arizonense]|uniref:LysM domain-containing protein n=1 Tax=Penicillium arizonense TaxID=1835702 RepID=A0A1F5LQF5_PENAI|nr:hypothetical protein PENARI_c004G11538 [Penicillium arizonense]OGE55357.1 hypothetical protein PENARI_c004G11538 [Penicillium arizonense]
MHLTALLTVGAVPAMGAALAPRAVNCDFATTADAGATCASFSSNWGLSVTDLQKLNPGITCPNLDTSKSYCVVGTATDEPTPPTSTTTTATQPTSTDSAPSNSPTMPGIASNCDGFHKFKSWNSQVDAKCSNLWLHYFVCVHVPGAVITSAPQPTAPTGPTPQMPGIVSNCKKYHLIKDGESCWSIYTEAGITLALVQQPLAGLLYLYWCLSGF